MYNGYIWLDLLCNLWRFIEETNKQIDLWIED